MAGVGGFAFDIGFALATATPRRFAVVMAGARVFATAILRRDSGRIFRRGASLQSSSSSS